MLHQVKSWKGGPVGVKYYTCDSCHTKPAVGNAVYVDGRGGEAVFRVCEPCRPFGEQHVRWEPYQPECPLCGGAHTPFCR